jgi:hypothetical protein
MVLQTAASMYSSSLRNAIEPAGRIILANAPRLDRRDDRKDGSTLPLPLFRKSSLGKLLPSEGSFELLGELLTRT